MNTPDQNKKAQQEGNFPGYPSYPASDDVTNKADREDYGTLNAADRNSTTGEATEQRANEVPKAMNASDRSDDPDSDVTPEDLAMLTATDQNRDMDDPDEEESLLDSTDDDGDPLNEPIASYGAVGTDLDVPGSELDEGNEAIGEEDEENNYYSLGGDDKSGLEDGENVTNR